MTETAELTLSPAHFRVILPVMRFLSLEDLTEEQKTDEFLIQKFGEEAVELTREWCRQVDEYAIN